MNPTIAEKWAKALESGEFTQATKRLRLPDDRMCCLGVLCELFRRETGKGEWVDAPHDEIPCKTFDGWTAALSSEVCAWAEIKITDREHDFARVGEYGPEVEDALYRDNDNGKTFPEIAAIIRQHVDQL